VRLRRDQLVLGAVAAAVLLAIVAFAASSGVKTEPAEPTPTAVPGAERELFGGSLEPRVRYRTRTFAPPLSFVVGDTEWLVEDAKQPAHLAVERRIRTGQPGSELPSRSSVVFSRIVQVFDPHTGHGLYVDDLHAWLRRHPDLHVGPATPVTVAGVRGERFDVAVDFTRPAHAAAACRPLLIVCTAIAPGRYFPDGTRMRTYVLPRPGNTPPLVIDIVGQTQRDLDNVEAPAAELLRTLRIGATGR
jgi:hypothetical protein